LEGEKSRHMNNMLFLCFWCCNL